MFYLQKESEFLEEYKDAAFIIGSPDFFGARAEDDDKINVLMMCIAYKDIETGHIEKNKKIVVRMKIDEKELDYYKKIIKRESVVKLKVRYEKEQGDELAEFLLADIIDNNYKDEDLNKMLKEYLKPIYYNDEVLGDFLYNRMVGSFDKEIEWLNNKKVLMAFDDSNENDKNKAVNFLRDIFLDKEEFDKKIKDYSARKIIREGNNISSKNGGNTIDEDLFIKEFMSKIDFLEIIVHEKDDYVNYRLGNKRVFKMDIIAEGNLSGNLFNAFISPF
ncbi:hypothetical protein BFL38_07300 [Brachyspira hampsonii]|uniref:Uncharacterized protein n=1 Tax=Brachyspira hampsonii TaxID=1287055 RepID=A0A1E5NEN8_9SPIR|nr:DUF2262 domain-containing protein [Brachyspira hampsonii]OEJ14640.1 hypothetical protein BFL38_07300 [Brachyspira hampsonii]